MSMLSTKVKMYAADNNVTEIDFLSDVILVDEGNGAYIKEWNLDIPKPDDATLAQYETQAEAKEALVAVQNQRSMAYPRIEDQLDYIYHNGVEAWKTDIIDPVKAKYPKPEQ